MGYQNAAGIKIKKRGPGRPAGDRPKKSELQRLYVKEGRSIRDVAEILGVSKDKVYRILEEHGIARRSPARRSKLEKYDLVELRSRAKEKGIRGLARELGINHGTLLHYLKSHPK
jgi:transposase